MAGVTRTRAGQQFVGSCLPAWRACPPLPATTGARVIELLYCKWLRWVALPATHDHDQKEIIPSMRLTFPQSLARSALGGRRRSGAALARVSLPAPSQPPFSAISSVRGVSVEAPSRKPECPEFSSGPCTKRPGYTLDALQDAALGRSHRSSIGKAKLAECIELTRTTLSVPEDYLIGIVPASDTVS